MNYKVLVNKENPLRRDYVPNDLVKYYEKNGEKIDPNHETLVERETLESFFLMKEAARKCNFDLIIDSAYRSYEYQQIVFDKYFEEIGEEAYERVALPGTSEHQTGLAIDIAFNIDGKYIDQFDDTCPQIKWLFENCYKYGFILRYPKNKEDITGYKYECWHFRYVGRDVSIAMHEENVITLEEYLLK